jgi:hypothetical protein
MPRHLALAALAACSTAPEPLEVLSIRCLGGVDANNVMSYGGAANCVSALRRELAHRYVDRIVSIIPVEHPVGKPAPHLEISVGTQELLVVYTRRPGPWPEFGNAFVTSSDCETPTSCGIAVSEYLSKTTVGFVASAALTEQTEGARFETSRVVFAWGMR